MSDQGMWDGFSADFDDGFHNAQLSGLDWLGPKLDGSPVQDVAEQPRPGVFGDQLNLPDPEESQEPLPGIPGMSLHEYQWAGPDDWLGLVADASLVQDISEQPGPGADRAQLSLPGPEESPEPLHGNPPAVEGHGSGRHPSGRCGPSEAEWNAHRPQIRELYLVKRKSLKEVMGIMAAGGFRARCGMLLV